MLKEFFGIRRCIETRIIIVILTKIVISIINKNVK